MTGQVDAAPVTTKNRGVPQPGPGDRNGLGSRHQCRLIPPRRTLVGTISRTRGLRVIPPRAAGGTADADHCRPTTMPGWILPSAHSQGSLAATLTALTHGC